MAIITQIDPNNFSFQLYEPQDENLISNFDVDTSLTGSSCVEFFVYDNNQNLLYTTYKYTSYTVQNDGQSAGNDNDISTFIISPGTDTENQGFNQGEYVAYYNFLTKQIGDSNTNLFISEISSDRTEIRLDSNILSDLDIVEQTNKFIQFREDSTYFVDFYLNFGSNDLIIANNIKLSNETTNNPTIVVKLYEPLPSQFQTKNELWVVTTLNEPEAFNVNFPPEPIVFQDSTLISGPNFNIPLKSEINNSTQNLSYTDLLSGAPTSSLDQLNSLLDSSSLSISVDYNDFTDFIHFSSAQTRLENFSYKVQLIEEYSSSLSNLTNVTSSATSNLIIQKKISDLITNFDKYEYFLYYNSGSSYSWPKTTTEPPYLLAKTTSAAALTWLGSANESNAYFGGMLLSASNFDDSNPDELNKSIPEYLKEDPNNQQYDLFVDMVAQYYDNVWLYTKDITQKYNADNRLDFGVSKDLVADAIRDFGVKLYQNNFSNDELYTAFLGLTPSGSLFPFPEITGSVPTPTGFEYVDTLISASNDIIPLDDVNKSLYKRIYHNIPYLLKSKGTIAGLRALITSYGIPDTILKISEFGGKDQVDANDYDYYFNKFNYAWDTEGNNFFRTPWVINTTNWLDFNPSGKNPNTIQLRFKPEQITGSTSPFGLSSVSQSLWYLRGTSGATSGSLVLEYTGSGIDSGSLVNSSGSYSGSIKDPYYQYGTLKYINAAGVSASLYLPFFDGGWWSTMITVDSDLTASLYAGNKIYNGKDGTSIGYFSQSSTPAAGWLDAITGQSYFARTGLSGYTNFSGSIQEIRYYSPLISESIFKDYIMNPLSIEGNSINSSPNELLFRAGLGSELNTSTDATQTSIHPKITGSWEISSSFASNSNYVFNSSPAYAPNTEYYFLDQFPAGIKNRITDKIRYEDNVVPSGDTLSAFRRVTQATEASASYTDSINYLEVAFSPQNEINDDIVSQLGYFNIGDYIGDPRQRSSSLEYYPELNNLSEDYFEKYIKNYDLVDFVRLIKFFDNSLFTMIKDFIPARTSLASGIVIKQHLLERNKYPQPQVSYTNEYLTGSVTSHQLWDPVNQVKYISSSKIESFSGGAGGMVNRFNGLSTSPYGVLGTGPDNRFNLTQSWSETNTSLSGSITTVHDSQAEFYNGEFSGSTILVTDGELNSECDEFKNVSTTSVPYFVRLYVVAVSGDDYNLQLTNWISDNNLPLDGNISIYYNNVPPTKVGMPEAGALYIKIPKIDNTGVDQSTNLESLNQIVIPNTTGTNVNYKIISVTEKPTFYLYQLVPNTQSPNLFGKLNYTFTGSLTQIGTFNGNQLEPIPIVSGNGDSYNFYSSTDKSYIFNTYAQKDLYLKASGSINVSSTANIQLIRAINASLITSSIEVLAETGNITSGGGKPFNIDYSLSSSLPGDRYYVAVSKGIVSGFSAGATFLITSSAATATSSIDTILEPYFSRNFSRAFDCQPLLNNVLTERENPFIQDLDYQTSQTVPVNYQAVVSESATKATVPESYYTSRAQINSRYLGSKNQSEKLNEWTPVDNIGTFGKEPSIDSRKSLVVYSDWIGGNTPEKHNSVSSHIQYIINEDGTINEPNLLDTSISRIQQAFESNQNLIVNLTDPPIGQGMEILNGLNNIDRGGYRIEPILYTQSGSLYTGDGDVYWTGSILVGSTLGSGSIDDVMTNAIMSADQTAPTGTTFATVNFDTQTQTPASVTNPYNTTNKTYTVPVEAVNDGLDLTFTTQLHIYHQINDTNDPIASVLVQIYNSTTGINVVSDYSPINDPFVTPGYGLTGLRKRLFNLSATVSNPVVGHVYNVRVLADSTNVIIESNDGPQLNQPGGQFPAFFSVTQIPSPSGGNFTVGENSIWGYPSPSDFSVITASQAGLNNSYGIYSQTDITNSGFKNISEKWSLKPGDEFRFEDREDRVFMVQSVVDPNTHPSGTLEVQLDSQIQTASINLDHFLIRRYVEDGSIILFDGSKPAGSSGPSIIKPQYVTKTLTKGVDEYIVDLTDKGLIT